MLNKLKSIDILSQRFKISWNKKHDGGSFSIGDGDIEIGINSYKSDPLYTIGLISHEIMEIILYKMGARFQNGREDEKYLFSFDHQTFENAIELHTEVMAKFIKNIKRKK